MNVRNPALLLAPSFASALVAIGAILAVSCMQVETAPAQSGAQPKTYSELPTETPADPTSSTYGYDYERRSAMIPMRDGVKLHTVILVPKGLAGGAAKAAILLTRTPYGADGLTTNFNSAHLGPTLYGYDNATDVIVDGGYIRVVQDVRGKYGSEGDYVMNRPLHGPLNPTPVDHATDTYDTIDWLVKNIPETNGKVGILGISYDGFLPLMALVNPHPALKVSVPMNPMVDGWMGDDWFHNGAFRQQNMPYIWEQEARRDSSLKWYSSYYDDYDLYLHAGSAGELGKERGLDQVGFWRKIVAHPSYDSFWSDQAVDKLLAAQPLKVPTMLVASLWDQEDIYGAMAVYRAIKPKDVNNDMVYLALGPWYHGQEIDNGSALGAVQFGSDTAAYFRKNVLAPFLAKYLKDEPPAEPVPPVSAYVTGANEWEKLPAWPAGCASGCAPKATPLYLEAGSKLGFGAPKAGDAAFYEYVSDPARPIPYRIRPIHPMETYTWSEWLTDDQRQEATRPDVAVFTGDVLTHPVKISGQPMVDLVASTSGTDSDWVVKLIDVYPDEVAGQPNMGGYQLAVSMDIFRGRYRESLSDPKPLARNQPLAYKFALPTVNHVFLPGHRMMVQVQSSWFPLYDRNPQTFVPNIFFAKPEDYQKATQRIYHEPGKASLIELPLLTGP